MQGHWSYGDAYYPYRFTDEYALASRVQHPRNVYLREALILPHLDKRTSKVLLPQRLNDTIDLMASTSPAAAGQSAGADLALVTQWIAENQADNAPAETGVRITVLKPGTRLTRDKIHQLAHSVSSLGSVVR